MCGLAGAILETKNRTEDELRHLSRLFTEVLVLSQERGPYATGVAVVNRDGTHRLLKQPKPASEFVRLESYSALLGNIDDRATILMGHTRWPTHGSHLVNSNNQPLVGKCVLSHNGVIYNADALFNRFGLPRSAEVDSEILLRMADDCLVDGTLDTEEYRECLALCRGQISAVLVARRDPESIIMIKGNKPLELRYHRRYQAILYASDAAYLDTVLSREPDWVEMPVAPMSLLVFRCDNLRAPRIESFSLAASYYQTSWLHDIP